MENTVLDSKNFLRFNRPLTALVVLVLVCTSPAVAQVDRNTSDEAERRLVAEVAEAAATRIAADGIEKRALPDDAHFIDAFNQLLAERYDARPSELDAGLREDLEYLSNQRKAIKQLVAGQMTIKIVGGDATTAYPECVALGSSRKWGASGVVIGPQLVLTAGHNIDNGFDVRVCLDPDVHAAGARVVKVEAIELCPDFIGEPIFENDLAILYLSEPLPDDVLVASRAVTGAINEAEYVNIVGYGSNDQEGEDGVGTRRVVTVGIASHSCNQPEDRASGCYADVELLAGKPGLKRDSCIADSGGPAFVRTPNGYMLAAITSRKRLDSLEECGDGGVYVRVDVHSEWIDSVVEKYLALDE